MASKKKKMTLRDFATLAASGSELEKRLKELNKGGAGITTKKKHGLDPARSPLDRAVIAAREKKKPKVIEATLGGKPPKRLPAKKSGKNKDVTRLGDRKKIDKLMEKAEEDLTDLEKRQVARERAKRRNG